MNRDTELLLKAILSHSDGSLICDLWEGDIQRDCLYDDEIQQALQNNPTLLNYHCLDYFWNHDLLWYLGCVMSFESGENGDFTFCITRHGEYDNYELCTYHVCDITLQDVSSVVEARNYFVKRVLGDYEADYDSFVVSYYLNGDNAMKQLKQHIDRWMPVYFDKLESESFEENKKVKLQFAEKKLAPIWDEVKHHFMHNSIEELVKNSECQSFEFECYIRAITSMQYHIESLEQRIKFLEDERDGKLDYSKVNI